MIKFVITNTIQSSVTRNKEIVQIPEDAAVYKYKYQGQERQDELGLNWDSFKYRNYDYALGRFFSVDPLAADYPYMTVYQFAGNKPTWYKELEGMESGVDLKMRLKEAAHAEEIGLMSAQEYLQGTQPTFITPYRPHRDKNGNVVIDNNWQAIEHYYRGNREPVRLGSKTVELIKNSKDVKHYIEKIKNGKTSGPAEGGPKSVDMEALNRGFHLGKMTFSYTTTCQDGNCTTHIVVDDDGFVDPNSVFSRFNKKGDDGSGPNHELGGTPYDYMPVEWDITFPNPGYPVDDNGIPQPIKNKKKKDQSNETQSN